VTQGSVSTLLAGSTAAYLEVDDPVRAREVLTRVRGVTGVIPEPPGLSVQLDGARRADLVSALVSAGVAVETVTARHRLEDAFLGLVGEETVR
jgi:ABC-2 type transport system ATP-binding protein